MPYTNVTKIKRPSPTRLTPSSPRKRTFGLIFWISDYRRTADVVVMLYSVLSFRFFLNDKFTKMNDLSYAVLDFTIYPPPKECHDPFIAPLKREQLAEVFGEITNFHISGYAADLGSELLKEIVAYYYLFWLRKS